MAVVYAKESMARSSLNTSRNSRRCDGAIGRDQSEYCLPLPAWEDGRIRLAAPSAESSSR
jgi:hypothetical protein